MRAVPSEGQDLALARPREGPQDDHAARRETQGDEVCPIGGPETRGLAPRAGPRRAEMHRLHRGASSVREGPQARQGQCFQGGVGVPEARDLEERDRGVGRGHGQDARAVRTLRVAPPQPELGGARKGDGSCQFGRQRQRRARGADGPGGEARHDGPGAVRGGRGGRDRRHVERPQHAVVARHEQPAADDAEAPRRPLRLRGGADSQGGAQGRQLPAAELHQLPRRGRPEAAARREDHGGGLEEGGPGGWPDGGRPARRRLRGLQLPTGGQAIAFVERMCDAEGERGEVEEGQGRRAGVQRDQVLVPRENQRGGLRTRQG